MNKPSLPALFLLSALGASCATLYAMNDGVHGPLAMQEFVPSDTYLPILLIFMAFIGLRMIAARPGAYLAQSFLTRLGDWPVTLFVSASSSIFGWGITICTGYMVTAESPNWLLATVIASYTIFCSMGALWGYQAVAPYLDAQTGLRFGPRKGEAVMLTGGWSLMLYSASSLFMWLN